MARPPWEVAEVLRRYSERYRQAQGGAVRLGHERVLQTLQSCRTAALGGHVDACERCGLRQISYNSCRNRHCPKCQCRAQIRWLEARLGELLDVEYFHVVFTVPQQIASIGLQNPRQIYSLLFQATSQTLRTIAADPRHLGAEIGFLAVLHTWGQTLSFHPHLHCIVPGGGFGPDAQRWISCRPGFFLPVRVLSRYFRRVFLEALGELHRSGQLRLEGALARLQEPEAFQQWLEPARRSEWIVYAKPPFGGPEQVMAYLGRYTHRVAISNARIVDVADGQVTFRWRDYRHHNRSRTMTLSAEEFIRRFLLHVLPDRFVRIRHFGFLANRSRAEKLQRARELIEVNQQASVAAQHELGGEATLPQPLVDLLSRRCPECRQGQLVCVEVFRHWPDHATAVEGIDSS